MIQPGRAARNGHRILVTEDVRKIAFISTMDILKALARPAN